MGRRLMRATLALLIALLSVMPVCHSQEALPVQEGPAEPGDAALSVAEELEGADGDADGELIVEEVEPLPDEQGETALTEQNLADIVEEIDDGEIALMAPPSEEEVAVPQELSEAVMTLPSKLTLGVGEKYALERGDASAFDSSNDEVAAVSEQGRDHGQKDRQSHDCHNQRSW